MTLYITVEQIKSFNRRLIEKYSPGEAITVVSPTALDMIVHLPMQNVFGQELYPSLFEKAAILFIQLVKKHVFANANKRTAFFVLVKFLKANGYALRVSLEEAVSRTVETALAPFSDALFEDTVDWINERATRIQ